MQLIGFAIYQDLRIILVYVYVYYASLQENVKCLSEYTSAYRHMHAVLYLWLARKVYRWQIEWCENEVDGV